MIRHSGLRAVLSLPAAVLALATPPVLADNCEAIRAGIEAKIRAAGVERFTLGVVDAGTAHGGQVVGRCAQGSKQIVYVRSAGSTAAAIAPAQPASSAAAVPKKAAAASRPRKGGPDIVECRDGSAPVNGHCPR